MRACVRELPRSLNHKYAVLHDGTLFPNPVASEVDSICRTDSFVRYMGYASDEWNAHGPIQCVPRTFSVITTPIAQRRMCMQPQQKFLQWVTGTHAIFL